MKRMEDSIQAVADSTTKAEAAKKKKTEDSIAAIKLKERTLCPGLIPFFEMSDRMVTMMRERELGKELDRDFGLISDSIIKLETKIMDEQFSKMDTACQRIFLQRMGQKTFDVMDGVMDKLR